MTDSTRARATPRRIPGIRVPGLLAVIVVIVVIAGTPGCRSMASSTSTDPPPTGRFRNDQRSSPSPPTAAPRDVDGDEHRGALGEADGAVPEGTTVFDDAVPAVANLDPALLRALRGAATEAAGDGVRLSVDSGWRSPKYQEQLRREAISKYGSEKEAARWVATPNTSAHVSGDAVDVGPADAARWLSEHGAQYGLCRIYGNEPWHYELRPNAIGHGCPRMYADPTQDPRMQQ